MHLYSLCPPLWQRRGQPSSAHAPSHLLCRAGRQMQQRGYVAGLSAGASAQQASEQLQTELERGGLYAVTVGTDDSLTIESIHDVYAGANWHERETHEMFGIKFDGHPDLRNMYLPIDFEGFPLRKDFPLLARMVKPWPGIVDVEPLPGGDDNQGGDE